MYDCYFVKVHKIFLNEHFLLFSVLAFFYETRSSRLSVLCHKYWIISDEKIN